MKRRISKASRIFIRFLKDEGQYESMRKALDISMINSILIDCLGLCGSMPKMCVFFARLNLCAIIPTNHEMSNLGNFLRSSKSIKKFASLIKTDLMKVIVSFFEENNLKDKFEDMIDNMFIKTENEPKVTFEMYCKEYVSNVQSLDIDFLAPCHHHFQFSKEGYSFWHRERYELNKSIRKYLLSCITINHHALQGL